jgi:S1-C subfamily serine protease
MGYRVDGAVKEARVGSSGVRLTALIGASIALAGCGASSPRRSTSTRLTRIETKTVTASSSAGTLEALVAKTRSGVVRIQAYGCGAEEIGTGFLIGPRLIATVDHVVNGALSITLKQGGRPVGTGTVIGEDPARDVALVRASRCCASAGSERVG